MSLRRVIVGFLLTLPVTSHALAWNALGHKTIAEIAWRQLSPEKRQAIVDTLRRHPRFDKDFAEEMTDDVLQADKATQDHWIFQQAATWPDIIRGNKEFDHPIWHYVDFPLYLNPGDRSALEAKLTFNRSSEYPTRTDRKNYNVMQALAYCRDVLGSRVAPADKAVAYSWMFHLVGDLHQPLHSTDLCSVEKFPDGDRGGNEVILTRGRNLHSLWDNLLGRRYYLQDVERTATELSDRGRYGEVWDTAAKEADPRKWVEESHALAQSAVYTDEVLNAIRGAPMVFVEERRRRRSSNSEPAQPKQQLSPIELSEVYMKQAGDVARQRIIAAGIRLGALLNN
jgi:S1/P1 nuclease